MANEVGSYFPKRGHLKKGKIKKNNRFRILPLIFILKLKLKELYELKMVFSKLLSVFLAVLGQKYFSIDKRDAKFYGRYCIIFWNPVRKQNA